MIKRVLILILLITGFLCAKAQLTVSTGAMTPTQYVQNVLVGSGVTVSNVTFSGDNNQIGEFDGTGTVPYIGLDNGIVMATGDVNVAVGPNDDGGAQLGGGNFGAGDSDLDILEGSGVGTNDAVVLEFDFVPTGDTVKFQYVFASEEYPEYVNSINDVFGFFLSGPGVSGAFSGGAANIALVPGTNTPISINTVNSGANPSYYVDNTPFTSNQTIQFDGYTTVLSAISAVQCGETYHIKIAIADASDDAWDSGVFLEAGSFSSNTVTLSSNIDVSTGDSILYEGCGTAYIDFERNDDADTAVFYYNIFGDMSVADYTVNKDSLVFLPGESVVTLNFEALEDNTVEPLEQVNIEIIQVICGVADTSILTFYISDYELYSSVSPDLTLECSSDTVAVWVVPTSGVDVLWDSGETADTIWVNPFVTTSYHVTFSDTCGNIANDSVKVNVPNFVPLSIDLTSDTLICSGLTVQLNAVVSGGIDSFYSWNHGLGTASPVSVTPLNTETYILTAQDSCGAELIDSVVVTVATSGISANLQDDAIACLGEVVVLDATTSGNIGSIVYNWSTGSAAPTIQVSPLVTTDYWVTINDACQTITDTVTVSVPAFDPFIVSITNGVTICRGHLITLGVEAQGGSGTYFYDWNGLGTTDSVTVQVNQLSTYDVTVSDACGNTQNLDVTIDIMHPTAEFGYEYTSDYTVEFYDSSYANIVGYQWFFNYGDTANIKNPIYTYLDKGEHLVSLQVTDIFGCTDIITDTIRPEQYLYYPNTFTPNGDGRNDVFLVKGMGIEEFEMFIFSRWGDQIFHSEDMEVGWDGTVKGELAPVGTYVFVLKTKSYEEDKTVDHRGIINVLR